MKYLIITGASGGIGEKTARLFAKEEWKIVNISRRSLNMAGVLNFTADFSNIGWESKIINDLTSQLHGVEKLCLVHNASSHRSDNIKNLEPTDFRRIAEVNIVAPIILNHGLIPLMPEGSSIIYIGSTLSEKAVANSASYVISKHALVGMMRATCQDLVGRNIHTSCICPGFTDTKLLRTIFNEDEENLKAILSSKVCNNRLILPEEIASLIFYCSNNPIINGAVIQANLGHIEH